MSAFITEINFSHSSSPSTNLRPCSCEYNHIYCNSQWIACTKYTLQTKFSFFFLLQRFTSAIFIIDCLTTNTVDNHSSSPLSIISNVLQVMQVIKCGVSHPNGITPITSSQVWQVTGFICCAMYSPRGFLHIYLPENKVQE